ncbi:MAG: transposase, partial [Planctomycetota bacterium]|nr:transposase [Planctomycetota bacterium]
RSTNAIDLTRFTHGFIGRAKKKGRRRGATIAFIDETGFRLQPVNRRTWAPRGQTPVQRAWDRYDRLSVISDVTLSPRRRTIGIPFQIHNDNIRTAEAVDFIKALRKSFADP